LRHPPRPALGEPRPLALLPGEPAGRISTTNAGAASFEATLEWHPKDDIPPGPVLSEPPFGAKLRYLTRTEDPISATLRVCCEVCASHAGELTSALDGVLRSVTGHAALTDATLEWRAVRLANPTVAPVALVEELARELWGSGFPVSFGPSYTPVPGAWFSVGIKGSEHTLVPFLETHPLWQTLDGRRIKLGSLGAAE
jgi:hypothetical protein